MAGERDNPSKDAVRSVRTLVERPRLNKVELYPSPLHGYKLLRLEPKVTTTLFNFLDTTIRTRAVDWEPQYNLMPVTFSGIHVVRNGRPEDTPQDKAKAKEKAQEPAAPEKPKADAAQMPAAEKAKAIPPPPTPPPPPKPAKPG
jgi:hypothetical protein